jgi:Tfp pilus assembly protein PilN
MDILINLLPPQRRREIKNLRLIGIVLKIGTMALFALFVLASFSYACLYFIGIEEKSLDQEIVRFKQTQSYRETQEAQDSLREYNKISRKVKNGLKKQKKYWDIIYEINSTVPNDVVLTNFMVSEEGIVSLKGLAYTRDDFLAFKAGLEESELLTNLKSPISNLVMDKDVNFEFTAEIK